MIARSLALAALLLLLAVPVGAQEPTPTPTATPVLYSDVPLSSGNTLRVEHTWSYGEVWIFLSIVALLLMQIGDMVAREVQRWTR